MFKRTTEALFLLTVFSLPIANPPVHLAAGLRTQFTEIVFLATAAMLAVSLIFGKISLRKGAFYLPVVLYAAAAAVSSIYSVDPERSAAKLAGVGYLSGLAILAFNVVRDQAQLKKALFAWLGGTVVVAGYAVFVLAAFYVVPENPFVTYALSHYGTFPPGNYPRIQSLFANPNMFCNYLSISWVVLLAAAHHGWIGAIAVEGIGAMILLAAAFTLSPGLGTFFLCTGIWFWYLNRKEGGWIPKAALALGVAAAIAFLAVTAVKFERDLTVSDEPSARVLTWSSAARTLVSHPVVGKGLGTMAADVRYEHQRLRDAHNTYLNVGAESGFLGLAAVLFFSWWFIKKPLAALAGKGSSGTIVFGLGLAFAGSFVYQGLAGSYEDARHLWLLAGLIGAVTTGDYREEPDE